MADYPALPLWTDAYLADTGHLTDAQHGLYLRLLMLMWRSPDCRIPNDDGWIAHKLGRPVEIVQSTVRPLVEEFCRPRGKWITQKRLLREFDGCRARSKTQAEKARSRWQRKKSDAAALPPGGTRLNPGNTSLPTPTPTPTPFPDKKDGGGDARATGLAESISALLPANHTVVNFSRIDTWVRQGFDPELDILPAIREVIGRQGPDWTPYSLDYFDKPIARAQKARLKPLPEVTNGIPTFLDRRAKNPEDSFLAGVMRAGSEGRG